MNSPRLNHVLALPLVLLVCLPGACAVKASTAPPLPLITEGQILYSPMWTTTAYLINSDGSVNHSWSSNYCPGCATVWLGNDEILRTIRVGTGPPGAGGAGGGVQIIQADGTLAWDWRYNTNGRLTHHDAVVLPNGNVLLIAWETKTRNEAIAAGRNPSHVSNSGMMPDHVIEVHPTGPTSGDVVWEWHVWDHLIQDYDSSKQNYGNVSEHPELVDVNYYTSTEQDWMHTNSIDYNEQFDQILISIHNFDEVWVIDHSTTTEEAAGHTGGIYGHGGDLLYRWGNPQVYRAGTAGDKKLFNQHDASWIKPGLPGAGHILVFNNGADRPGSHYSTVDEFAPPVNEQGVYYLEPGSAYGPTNETWIYTANPPTSFYAYHISGAQRLASGDTLISNGETGKLFEVTPNGTTVWQYQTYTELFKTEYIPPGSQPQPGIPDLDCTGSLAWTDVTPGSTVTGNFTVKNIGSPGSLLNWTVNASELTWGNWTVAPSSGIGLTPENGSVTVQVTVVAPDTKKQTFEGYLTVINQDNASDFDTVPISLTTPTSSQNIYHDSLVTLLKTFLQTFWRLLENRASFFTHHWLQ